MSLFRRVSLVCSLVLVNCYANADTLTTTNGKTIKGKLIGVDAQGVILSTTESDQLKVSGKEIHLIDLGNAITPPAKDVKYHELELTDGSIFRIAKFSIKGNMLAIDLMPGPPKLPPPALDINLSAVFSVMRSAEDLKSREAWKKLLAGRGKRDLYVIREAEGLNFVPGTILGGNDAGDLISFEKEDGVKAELKLSRATGGLIFARPQPTQIAPTLCKVLDVFGNSLIAQSLDIGKNGVTVTTVSGVVVKYASQSAIAKLDYAQGNIAFLSDLDPLVDAPDQSMDEKKFRLNVATAFTKDQNVANEPLKLGSESYSKGISIAPDTRLTFNIGGDFREFKAVIGMQENSPDANLEAKVTIETEEGRVLFSEVLKRKDKPRAVGLDVKGVKQLLVSVDANLPVNGNRVIMADARLQK
jgi:hypothetical protein